MFFFRKSWFFGLFRPAEVAVGHLVQRLVLRLGHDRRVVADRHEALLFFGQFQRLKLFQNRRRFAAHRSRDSRKQVRKRHDGRLHNLLDARAVGRRHPQNPVGVVRVALEEGHVGHALPVFGLKNLVLQQLADGVVAVPQNHVRAVRKVAAARVLLVHDHGLGEAVVDDFARFQDELAVAVGAAGLQDELERVRFHQPLGLQQIPIFLVLQRLVLLRPLLPLFLGAHGIFGAAVRAQRRGVVLPALRGRSHADPALERELFVGFKAHELDEVGLHRPVQLDFRRRQQPRHLLPGLVAHHEIRRGQQNRVARVVLLGDRERVPLGDRVERVDGDAAQPLFQDFVGEPARVRGNHALVRVENEDRDVRGDGAPKGVGHRMVDV